MTTPTTPMRLAACALVLAATAAGLAGCGGKDSSSSGSAKSDKATTKEFCGAFNALLKDAASISNGKLADQIAAVKKGAQKVDDVGAPDGMPTDAAHGLTVFTTALEGIKDDATEADLQKLGSDLSAADSKDAQTFTTWAQTTCVAGSGSASPSPSPSS